MLIIKNKKINSSLLSYIPLLAIFGALFLAILPLIQRSLWGDEIALMNNFPLDSLYRAFVPLPRYAQAGTPIHNVILSIFSEYKIEYIRIISFLLVIGGVLISFRFYKATPIVAFQSGLAILASTSLIYFSTEIKHYSFEILGTAISIGWILQKDPDSNLSIKDLSILLISMLLGISTIIISVLALATYTFENYLRTRRLSLSNLLVSLLFMIFTAIYYMNISYITSIQVQSYFNVYDVKGLTAIKYFFSAILAVLDTWYLLPAIISTIFLLISNIRYKMVTRFVLFGSLVFFVTLTLSYMGLYPAREGRHLAWLSAFILAAFLLALDLLNYSKRYKKFTSWGLVILLTFPAVEMMVNFSQDPSTYTKEQNTEAVKWLIEQKASSVGLWVGAQGVIEYYRRHHAHELEKHSYFGLKNMESKSFIKSSDAPVISIKDYANSLIEEAPKNEDFLIFASHLNFNENNNRFSSLINALDKQHCSYQPVLKLKKVFFLKTHCPV